MTGGTGEPIRTVDGVTLHREHLPDAFDYPAVSLRLRSDRDERASVRLTKTLPPALAAGQVGFHPDYDQGGWTVEDRTIRYETVVPPNGEVTTLYAIRTDAPNPFERIESPPGLDVEPVDDGRTAGEADAGVDRNADSDRADDASVEPERQDPGESTTSIGWFEDDPDRDPSGSGGDDSPSGTAGQTPEDGAVDAESTDESVDGTATEESSADADEPAADETVEGEGDANEPDADAETDADETATPGATDSEDAADATDSDADAETTDGDEDAAGKEDTGVTDSDEDAASSEEGAGVTDREETADGEADPAAQRQSVDGSDSALKEAVTRIESGDASPAQRRRLVDAIAAETDPGSELASRIERLQRRMRRRRNLQVVSEVVHDQRGPLDQVIDDLENRIDGLESSTNYLGENLALTAEYTQRIEDRLDDRLVDVADDVADVEDGLGTIDDRLVEVTDELRDLQERVETLERTIASLGGIVDRIETLEARTETVEANAEAIAALREDVETLHDATGRNPTDGPVTGDSASNGWRDPETGPDGRTEPGTRNAQDDP